MCDRCDAMDSLGAQVDEAVTAEALPRVCSTPECTGVPVVRVADEDSVDLLCVEDAMSFAALAGVRMTSRAVESAGVVIPDESMFALLQATRHVLAHGVEVL